MNNLKIYAAPLGRLFLAALFIWAGYTKLFVFGPAGTTKFLTSVGAPLPELATWIAIIVELIGGILILIGFQTRWVALILAVWCVFTALAFHLPSSAAMHDVTQVYKNFAIAGGFLYVFAFGPGIGSADHSMGKA